MRTLLAKIQKFRLENAKQTAIGPKLLNSHLEKRLLQTHNSYLDRLNSVKTNKIDDEIYSDAQNNSSDLTNSQSSLSQTQSKPKNIDFPKTQDSMPELIARNSPVVLSSKDEELEVDTEAAIVNECLEVIDSVCNSKAPNISSKGVFAPKEATAFTGEELKSHLHHLSDCVNNVRRLFLDPELSVVNSRCYVLPEVTGMESDLIETGLDFSDCANSLVDAILSTPREHMLHGMTEVTWLDYAQQMWNLVRESPILTDLLKIYSNLDLSDSTQLN
ncbi:hypothetical protein Ciccas_001293 [Cichlidogyrus casuarinus]|uniref:Uncharacterized protein n=1 Tax=Cichlidogyrus casuarinus TaxID=1844966 RepID=A0ABD2QKI4_9PLAT